MEQKIETPKYLTEDTCRLAIECVLTMLMDKGEFERRNLLSRHRMCHVGVIVPTKEGRPHIFYEYSLGKEEWPHQFDEIGRSKGIQIFEDRNDGGTNCVPHLLFRGDTPYWGAVKRAGIVVFCSGVQAYFDRMISGMIADMIIALTYHAFVNSGEEGDLVT